MQHRHKTMNRACEHALKQLPKGAASYRQQQTYVLKRIIRDLSVLNQLPVALSQLTQHTMRNLITYWREQGNQDNTIMRKLSILKQVILIEAPEYAFPSLKSLGISLSRHQPKKTKIQISPDELCDPLVRHWCQWQVEFGLRKHEALHVQPEWASASHHLRIPRNVAYNQRDRIIPIVTIQQSVLIQQLQNGTHWVNATSLNHQTLSLLHRDVLLDKGVHDKDYFRHQYAYSRYHTLCKNYSERQALALCRDELGYKANAPLKRILQCQSDN